MPNDRSDAALRERLDWPRRQRRGRGIIPLRLLWGRKKALKTTMYRHVPAQDDSEAYFSLAGVGCMGVHRTARPAVSLALRRRVPPHRLRSLPIHPGQVPRSCQAAPTVHAEVARYLAGIRAFRQKMVQCQAGRGPESTKTARYCRGILAGVSQWF